MPKPIRKSKGKYTRGNIRISIQGGYYYITSDCCLGLVLSEKELNDLANCIFLSRGAEIIDAKPDIVTYCTCGELSEEKRKDIKEWYEKEKKEVKKILIRKGKSIT